jgi:hypothetical protein
MVLMIAGAVVVEGALLALPSWLGSAPIRAAPSAPSRQYFVEVRDPGEDRAGVETRPSN